MADRKDDAEPEARAPEGGPAWRLGDQACKSGSRPDGPTLTPKRPGPLNASSARRPKPSGGHSTASGLVTSARGRVRSGDAAGPPDEAAASGAEVPAGRIQHPPDKPLRQERRLTSVFDPASERAFW